MKHYLQITFNEKDKAKAEASKNGTKIQWDSMKKKWFWEGKSLPEFLEKYTYNTRPQDYAKRKSSFNFFLNSDAGKRYHENRKNDFLEDLGCSDDEYLKEKQEQEKIMEDDNKKFKKEHANTYMCMSCLEEHEGKVKRCSECGSRKIEKLF